MICPQCSSGDTRVIDSRTAKDGRSIRRRRECNQCSARFTTSEEIIRDGVVVEKRDGSIEDFNQQKIINSLKIVFQKRPVESERIHLLINDLISTLEKEFDASIPTQAIATHAMQRLQAVDEVAYVRYASSYVRFKPTKN